MGNWLQRVLGFRQAEPSTDQAVQGEALLELLQKSARHQARLALRLDELDRKLEGGFADLRQTIKNHAMTAADSPTVRWDDLLDAMDLLQEAIQSSGSNDPASMAEGLRSILDRLEHFSVQSALTRVLAPDTEPDGRFWRVVGVQEDPNIPDGAVVRVVRAAILSGERVIREGEVITNRNRQYEPIIRN